MKHMTAEQRSEPTPDPNAKPDAWKLRLLADWHDLKDDERGYTGAREVQTDLRSIATELDATKDTAAERDRLKASNTVLVAGLEELETFAPWGGRTQKDIWAFQKWVQKIATNTLAKAKGSTP